MESESTTISIDYAPEEKNAPAVTGNLVIFRGMPLRSLEMCISTLFNLDPQYYTLLGFKAGINEKTMIPLEVFLSEFWKSEKYRFDRYELSVFRKVPTAPKVDVPVRFKPAICDYLGSLPEYCLEEVLMSRSELAENGYPNSAQVEKLGYLSSATRTATSSANYPRIIGCDCEMVSTTKGLELARVTLVDSRFEPLLDCFVVPDNPIVNYNTRFSGITRETLVNVTSRLQDAQREVLRFLGENSILVGHSLESDLHALRIVHARVIDTSVLFPYVRTEKESERKLKRRKYKLRHLVETHLKRQIQFHSNDKDPLQASGALVELHDALEDATAALELVQHYLMQRYPAKTFLKNAKYKAAVSNAAVAPVVSVSANEQEDNEVEIRIKKDKKLAPISVGKLEWPKLLPSAGSQVPLQQRQKVLDMLLTAVCKSGTCSSASDAVALASSMEKSTFEQFHTANAYKAASVSLLRKYQ